MSSPPTSRTFRLPALAYLIVVFLLFCAVPLAFARDASYAAKPTLGPRVILMLVPVAAVFYIARTATIVDATGIRVRALFGSRRLGWDEMLGLSVDERSVYAVCGDGSVRLPCVRVSDLAALSRASDGRLPELPAPTAKYAPSRRRRR